MQAGGLTVETKLRLPVMMMMTFNWKEEVKLVLGRVRAFLSVLSLYFKQLQRKHLKDMLVLGF